MVRDEDMNDPNGVIFRDSKQKEMFKAMEKRGMFLRCAFYWKILEYLELIEPIS